MLPLYNKFQEEKFSKHYQFNPARTAVWTIRFINQQESSVLNEIVEKQNTYFNTVQDLIGKSDTPPNNFQKMFSSEKKFFQWNEECLLQKLVREIAIPALTQESISVPIPMFNIFTSSHKYTFETITITFNDVMQMPVQTFFKLWTFGQIVNPWDGTQGRPDEYKMDIEVEFGYQLKNNIDPLARQKFYGVFPTSISIPSNLSYETQEIVTVSATLSIDYFEYIKFTE